jgi:hypothetical protein
MLGVERRSWVQQGRGLEGFGEEARRKCGNEELEKRTAFECGHRSLREGVEVSIDPEAFQSRIFPRVSSFAANAYLSCFATEKVHPAILRLSQISDRWRLPANTTEESHD